jgi:Ion channel
MFVVGMVCFLLIPAAVFSAIQSWSYGTGIYYGIITLTSVGFGDYVAGTVPIYLQNVGLRAEFYTQPPCMMHSAVTACFAADDAP